MISSPERHRCWSEDQKRAIVAEAFAPGSSVCAVAAGGCCPWADLAMASEESRSIRQDAAQDARHADPGSRRKPRLADRSRQTLDRHEHKSTTDQFRFSPRPAQAQSFRHRGPDRPRTREQ